jgi:outer membrane biosynthesis protein TonB
VAESVIAATRIAGVREITLPPAAKQALVASGRRQTAAAVKLCLDEAGVPTRIDIVASTGFAEADERLRYEIAAWRYRPYRVNGTAVPVCTAVTFRYQIDE